jgi:hypothetical protein
MALVKGVNSYADLTEADTYFENKLDVAAWTDAAEVQKEQALCTATSILDEMVWIGIISSETQDLAFPRKEAEYFDPKLGTMKSLNSIEVPGRIVNATYELAYHLLNNDGLYDDTGMVKNLELGDIVLETVMPANKTPRVVKSYIKPLLSNSGARTWWRAN